MANTTSNPKQFEKLRLLGSLEQFSSKRHHLGFYNNVGISASYSRVADALGSLKNAIFAAVATVIQKHPVLSAIPMNEDSPNPYFVRLPTIELEDSVTFVKREKPYARERMDTELDHILEAHHNKDFKTNLGELPFWRLIIIAASESEFVASFIFHHSLGDGTSGLVFHRDFLSALQNTSPYVVSSVVHCPENELLPNLELLHPLPMSITKPKHVPTKLWSGEKVTMPTRSHFRSLFLSKEISQRFIQACKSNSTTVTATIPVIVAVGLVNNISNEFEEVECTVPVSLRRWMPKPVTGDSFGVWIDAFSQYYRRENVSFFSWGEARRSRDTINEYLKTEGESINVAKFQKIKNMGDFFLSRVGMERGTSFDVSNLGSLRVEEKEGWSMGRVLFSRSAFVSGSAIAVGVVSGADGCLSLGFSWQSGIVSLELIEKLMQRISTEIESIARTYTIVVDV